MLSSKEKLLQKKVKEFCCGNVSCECFGFKTSDKVVYIDVTVSRRCFLKKNDRVMKYMQLDDRKLMDNSTWSCFAN